MAGLEEEITEGIGFSMVEAVENLGLSYPQIDALKKKELVTTRLLFQLLFHQSSFSCRSRRPAIQRWY
jgi:hypothetical protein